MSRKNFGLFLILMVSLIYILLSYIISQHEDSIVERYIVPFLLLIPAPGVIAFLYGHWSGKGWLSFSIGFSPVFIFFVSSAFLENYTYTSVFLGSFMGVLAGIIGYSGATKKKGKMDWIILVPASMVLWIFTILGGMR